MIKLAVSGCQGRMGLRIVHLAQEDPEFKIFALLEKENHPATSGQLSKVEISSDPKTIKGAEVLIEFTSPDATMRHLEFCKKFGVRMVIGTTGLTPEQTDAITQASNKIPIVFASNMSVGVNIFFALARTLASKTKNDYTVKITEAHHIHKKDAPSGTAKTLARFIEEASGKKVTDIESIREGEIIGDHKVVFESDVDTITISHSAKTRDIFAKGSLVAAKFLKTKTKGLFSMEDVLEQMK